MASLTHMVWKLYVDNLVYYEADSWVQRIASTFRILAFVLISPVLILTGLVRHIKFVAEADSD